MNARSREFEFSVEGRQVEEVALSIFHTLLFHRTSGKFHYKQEESYSVGTIGYEDVDCDFVDLTYVRCASADLDRNVRREVTNFSNLLLNTDNSGSGTISLEFYQKKKTRWYFQAPDVTPWEIWNLKLSLMPITIEQERQKYREKMGELLGEKMIYITEVMNSNEYVPKMPNQSELELIFDTSYIDVQPYLFRIYYESNGPENLSVGTTVRKLIKDTLAL